MLHCKGFLNQYLKDYQFVKYKYTSSYILPYMLFGDNGCYIHFQSYVLCVVLRYSLASSPVAAQILKMAVCPVTCDNAKVHVKPKSLILEPSVKFEVQYFEMLKIISFLQK